ncbi:hypothetical protein [Jutongia sp.]|uniref:hypothetical protein n=1 Tax=Jutongia sp. TaxID=2944204 RepID=UPI003079937B
MPYKYCFNIHFIHNLFNPVVLIPAVTNAENIFNILPRKNRKQISVKVNTSQKCLEIVMLSAIPINRINWLRSMQYFSKVLSMETGMNAYITSNGRLLVS